jgi:hypothetical protein
MAPSTPKTTAEMQTPAKQAAAKAPRPAKAAKAEKPTRSARPATTEGVPASPATGTSATKASTRAVQVNTIKLRDLVDTVAAATGAKKPDAKASVEAVLAAIGAGLAAKSVLVVPPLGKLRVAKSNGSVLTLKLRLADTSRAAGLALADDGEDS